MLPRRRAVAVQRHLRRRRATSSPTRACSSASTPRSAARNGVVLLPGSVAELTTDGCATTHPVPDLDEFFANKEAHLRDYQDADATGDRRGEAVLAAPRDRRGQGAEATRRAAARRVDLPGHRASAARCGSTCVGYDGETVESVLVDFPNKEVRRAADEKVRYRFRTERALVEHLLYIDEVDWVNSLFLSCRFSAARIGQYNEFVYSFFKCLSEERLQYAEGWYDEHQRTHRRRGHHARRLAGAAPVPASQGGSDPVRHRRRQRAHLPAARLEVRPGQRPVPHQRRAPDPGPSCRRARPGLAGDPGGGLGAGFGRLGRQTGSTGHRDRHRDALVGGASRARRARRECRPAATTV